MNILLKSGKYNKNLKCKDFLEVGCFDYIEEKFDGNIIMNPPFALTKNYDLSDKESKEVFHTKTKSGTMLFLMSALNSIKEGNQLIMVSPNGKEIFNKNKEFVNIRKNVIEKYNLYKIAILPDGAFKPYTGVQTLVLMIKKGEKTKEIQFVKVNKNKDDSFTETKICKVKYNELIKKEYSWNYKEYYVEEKIKYGNIEYIELNKLCNIQNGKFTTSQMDNNGIYDFYSGEANQPVGKHSEYCFDGEKYIIMIRAGGSNGKYGDQIGLGKVFITSGKTAGTSPTIKLELKNNDMNIYYLYNYLKINKNNIADMAHYTTSLGRIPQENINNMQIPVPPTEVQNLIVKELDLMYREKERLLASTKDTELVKQIHFDSLLLKCKDKQTVKLGDVCDITSSGIRITEDNRNNGKYPYYGANGIISHIDQYKYDGEYILTAESGTIGSLHYVNDKFFPTKDLWVIKSKYINTKYLLNFMKTLNLIENKTGTCIPHMSKNKLADFNILVPSIKDQEEIIKEMEKHDERVKCQEQEIKLIDKLIKERFECHLQRCKDSKDKPKEELEDSDSDEEEEPKKKSKSKKPKDDSDSEEEEEPVKKSKSKKPKDDSDSEDEETKRKSDKKIKVKSKKQKNESDSEEDDTKPKSDKKIKLKKK